MHGPTWNLYGFVPMEEQTYDILVQIDMVLRLIAFFYFAEWGYRAYVIVARRGVKDVFPGA